MRLVGIDEAWEQYSSRFEMALDVPPEGVFVFEGASLVAGCCLWPAPKLMVATMVVCDNGAAASFLFRVLRAHEKVTRRHALVEAAELDGLDALPLELSSMYRLKEEVPQARKKETDPGDSPHTEPTDQGGTGEDVPPAVVESKPRARRKKKAKK